MADNSDILHECWTAWVGSLKHFWAQLLHSTKTTQQHNKDSVFKDTQSHTMHMYTHARTPRSQQHMASLHVYSRCDSEEPTHLVKWITQVKAKKMLILNDKHSLLFCESVQDQWGLVQIKPVHLFWGETPDKLMLCILVHFSFNNSNFLND